MPSWPTRLLHGSPPTKKDSTPPIFPCQGHSFNNDSQLDSQHQVKALADGPALVSASSSTGLTPVRALQHSRSVSHPVLSSLKSHGGRARKVEEIIKGGVETLDALASSVTPASLSTNAQMDTNHKTATQQRDNDLVSGKCATCDSTVRWPRHLNVYRCAVCLMVNDLKQMTMKPSNNHGSLLDSQVESEDTPGAGKLKPGTQRAENRNFFSNARHCSSTHLSCRN